MPEPIRPSPRPAGERSEPLDVDEKTPPPWAPVDGALLQRKVDEAREAGERTAKATGLAWGASLIAVAIGLSFGVWFKIESSIAQSKEEAVEKADAGADKKLAPLQTEIAVVKVKVEKLTDDVAELKKASDKSAEQQSEMLRLLRKR